MAPQFLQWYTTVVKTTFNVKVGIISGMAVLIVGFAAFIFLGATVDYGCKYTTPHTAGCRVYNGWNSFVQGYTDIWRSLFARRCIGGNGPDDCIAPDAMIMVGTLFVIGFTGGGLIWRKENIRNSLSRI